PREARCPASGRARATGQGPGHAGQVETCSVPGVDGPGEKEPPVSEQDVQSDDTTSEQAETSQEATTSERTTVSASVKRLEEEGEIAADYLEELLDIADLDGDIDLSIDHGRASVEIVNEGGSDRELR